METSVGSPKMAETLLRLVCCFVDVLLTYMKVIHDFHHLGVAEVVVGVVSIELVSLCNRQTYKSAQLYSNKAQDATECYAIDKNGV